MRGLYLAIMIGMLLYSGFGLAGEAGDIEAVALTVYNQDLALIKETRPVSFGQGVQDLVLSDVSGMLRPETVHLSVPAGVTLELLEQNFDYDLVSQDKLLEKFIGKPLMLVDDQSGASKTVTLLSTYGGLVVEDAEGRILLNPPGRVVLPPGAANDLLLKPTLSWMVFAPQSGQTKAEITYMSGGLGWQADYVLLLNADDTLGALEGWVTLSNYSGTTYRDAKLKLVAGDVNVVSDDAYMGVDYAAEEMMADGLGGGGFEEEAFFEYHLYDLQRPTTIRNNQQKQIGLLTAPAVPLTKRFVFDGQYGGEVGVYVDFTNEEEAGLGLPLPAGVIRVSKADSQGDIQFVGEDSIQHTPKDEDLRLYIGNAFDLVGETNQTDYKDLGKGYQESYEVVLKNHKESENVVITVSAQIYGDWELTASNYDYRKKDAETVEFDVPVKAGGEATLNFTYKVTWK